MVRKIKASMNLMLSAQKKNACKSKQYYLAAEEIGCLVFGCGSYNRIER